MTHLKTTTQAHIANTTIGLTSELSSLELKKWRRVLGFGIIQKLKNNRKKKLKKIRFENKQMAKAMQELREHTADVIKSNRRKYNLHVKQNENHYTELVAEMELRNTKEKSELIEELHNERSAMRMSFEKARTTLEKDVAKRKKNLDIREVSIEQDIEEWEKIITQARNTAHDLKMSKRTIKKDMDKILRRVAEVATEYGIGEDFEKQLEQQVYSVRMSMKKRDTTAQKGLLN